MKKIGKFIGASIIAVIFLSGMSGVTACELNSELIAGQDTSVGNIHVLHSGSCDRYMTITYETYGEWDLTETHLAVATSFSDIPQTNANKPNKPHNPKIGKFEYSDPHSAVKSYKYTIDLAKYITPTSDGRYIGELYVAAHAVVEHPCLGEETAWGDTYGIPFNPSGKGSWALYFIVELY